MTSSSRALARPAPGTDEFDRWVQERAEEIDAGWEPEQEEEVSEAPVVVGPGSKPMTIRLPGELVARLKSQAARQGVPYQSMIRIWLEDRVAGEPVIAVRRVRSALAALETELGA